MKQSSSAILDFLGTGQVFVVCAPSGTGKSTLVSRLLEEHPKLTFSISCTTREPREGEQDGVDYHFLDRGEFISKREGGYFAEWAEVHGNFYGTPREAAVALLKQGKDVIFDIDVQGAMQLRENLGFGCYIFILPPSYDSLVERLTARGTDSEEVITRRLHNAKGEMALAENFDYLVINDDLDRAYSDLQSIYVAQGLRTDGRRGLVKSILAGWPKD